MTTSLLHNAVWVIADAGVKAAPLLALAGLACLALRWTSAAVRHHIWSLAFCGAVLLPIVSSIVPQWRIAVLPAPQTVAREPIARPTVPEQTTPRAAPGTSEIAPAPTAVLPMREEWSPEREMTPPVGEWRFADGRALAPQSEEVATASRSVSALEPAEIADVAAGWTIADYAAPIACFWLAGFLIVMAPFAAGAAITWRLVRRARRMTDGEAITLLESHALRLGVVRRVTLVETECSLVPMTVGVLKPLVVLPADWRNWPAERARFVLLHELAHIRRLDVMYQAIGRLACGLYWFNPLAWYALRRLRIERELACDDCVIAVGETASAYAGQLLEIARAYRPARLAVGIAITRSSKLEERITSLFDRARPHLPVSRRIALSLASLAVLLVLCLSVVRLTSGETAVNAETIIATDGAATDPSPTLAASATETLPHAASANMNPTATDADNAARAVADSRNDITFTFSGTVLDPDGKPANGAKVELTYPREIPRADDEPAPIISDESGRFTFSRRESEFADAPFGRIAPIAMVVAAKEGFGFAAGLAFQFEVTGQMDAQLSDEARQRLEDGAGKKTGILTLVRDDVPVRGRILNTEGLPVGGARVQPRSIDEGNDGTLDTWEAATSEESADAERMRLQLRHIWGSQVTSRCVPPALTDVDGWFTLKGIGRERIAHCVVSGPGIETTNLLVRSRAGEVRTIPQTIRNPGLGRETYYPCDFTLVVGPSVAVEGRVTDDKTGQPLAGMHLRARRLGDDNDGRDGPIVRFIHTTTGPDGKYRLEGLPIGISSFYILPPKNSRHLAGAASVETRAGSAPIVRNVALTAGVVVRGRATDERTGEPLRGALHYFACQTNPHLEPAAAFGKADLLPNNSELRFQSDADGRFEIPVLPGAGILAFSAGTQYPRGVGVDAIDCPRLERPGMVQFLTLPVRCRADYHNLVVPLNPQPGADELTVNLTLRAGARIIGRVLSPDGQPLSNYYFAGDSVPANWRQHRAETFTIDGYLPTDERRLMFYYPERDLVGLYDLTGKAPERLDVTLRPGGTLVGRVLGADGQPMEGLWLIDHVRLGSDPKMDAVGGNKDRGLLVTTLEHEVRTDANGRFKLTGIIPGLRYSAYVAAARKAGDVPGGGLLVLGTIFRDVTAEPGETKDLGDLRPMPDKRAAPQKPQETDKKTSGNAAAASTPAKPAEPRNTNDNDTITIRGHVLDPDGKPFGGAKIYALRMYGGTLTSGVKNVPLAQTSSRADGAYGISWSKSEFERSNWGVEYADSSTTIAAFAKGFGPIWKPISELAGKDDVSLQLVPDDVPVMGRVVDLQGRPSAGVRVGVRRLWAPRQGDLTEWLDAVKAGEVRFTAMSRLMTHLPDCDAEAIPGIVTDAQGKFRISGIGRERYAEIVLEGEQIAYSEGALVTRRIAPFELKEMETPPQVPRYTSRLYGSDFDFAALPSRPVTGTVRDAETGKGVAGARIFSWRFAGSRRIRDLKISTTTDGAGRFRLTGMPEGKGGSIMVLPAADQPYFGQVIDVAVDANLDPVASEIELHRGIWLTGKVTDKATGAPGAGRVDWFPFRSNEFAQKLTAEFGGIGNRRAENDYHTKPDGTFRVLALPGRGVVAVQAANHLSYRYGAGSEKIEGMNRAGAGPPGMLPFVIGAQGSLFHTIKEVAIPAGAESFECDLELDPGASVRVSVIDPDGKPVTGFKASGQRPYFSPVEGPTFEIRNLAAGDKRTLFGHHEARKLGKATFVDFDGKAPTELTIRLEPCATVEGRLLTTDGDPISGGALYIQALQSERPNPRTELTQQPLDKEGRFRFTGLLPGCDYQLVVHGAGIAGYVAERLSIKPSETIDLGTVSVKPVGN